MTTPNPTTPSGQLPEDLEADAVPEEVRGLSQSAIVRKRFIGNTPAVVSIVVFVLIALMAFTSIGFLGIPGWWHYGYEDFSTQIDGGHPTFMNLFNWGDHPFGQDRIGRDYFAMTMRGTQQSIIIMFVIGAVGGFLGVVVGALSGYFRGWIEAVLMRIVDIIIIIPLLILAAVLGRIAGTHVSGNMATITLGAFIGVIIWTGLSRLVRGEFLSLREREFVDAAHIAGASNTRIMFKHILPNAVGVIIVNVTLLMSSAILLETALSFLGLGVRPPDVSLGSLISDNQEAFSTRPWLFWFPGLFIVAICLSINFIGDGLRDAFDPRQKKFNSKKAKDRGIHGSAVKDSASAAAIAERTEGGSAQPGPGAGEPGDGPSHRA